MPLTKRPPPKTFVRCVPVQTDPTWRRETTVAKHECFQKCSKTVKHLLQGLPGCLRPPVQCPPTRSLLQTFEKGNLRFWVRYWPRPPWYQWDEDGIDEYHRSSRSIRSIEAYRNENEDKYNLLWEEKTLVSVSGIRGNTVRVPDDGQDGDGRCDGNMLVGIGRDNENNWLCWLSTWGNLEILTCCSHPWRWHHLWNHRSL